MVSEAAQEVLEDLWTTIVENKKTFLDASNYAPEVIAELKEHGLIALKGKQVKMTGKGEKESAMAIRRHRLAERLLADVFNTVDQVLDDHACRLEHALFDGLDEAICTLLGHPHFCPHGKPIPEGKCCEKKLETIRPIIVPLSEMRPNEQGQIAYVHMSQRDLLDKMLAMGILPGNDITLIQRSPSFVFKSGHSQFAVDEEIASEIFIRIRRH